MKRSILLVHLIILIFIFSCQNQESATRDLTNDDHTAIEATIEKYIKAVLDQDLKSLAQAYTVEGIRLEPNRAVIGRKEIESLPKDENAQLTNIDWKTESINGEGNFARWWGTFRSNVVIKPQGNEIIQEGKWLAVLRKQPDGTWLIESDIWNLLPTSEN
jgi:ketosteroid isomerase-like protein